MSKNDQNEARQTARTQMAETTKKSEAISGQAEDILGRATSTSASILPSVVSGYSDIASTGGGIDPSILGTARATFGRMAETGGISPEDTAAMQGRAAEGARAAYDVGAAEATRARAATGGYGMSGAITGNLARGASQAASRAITDTNASIAGMRQQGQLAGAAGLMGTGESEAKNRLAALGGLSNIYGLNETQISHTIDSIIKNFQVTGQLNQADLSILTELANQPGVFDKIMGSIKTLGGAASGVMTGIGALKTKP